jgi:hypothetical protein
MTTSASADASVTKRTAQRTLTPSPARAGIGGVGSGTGVIAIAQTVGLHTPFGAFLAYIAPAITVIGGAALYYLEVQASQYLEQRSVNSAKKTLEHQLDNPRTSDSHKREIRKMLEELEKIEASIKLDRVKLIHIVPPKV